MLWGSRFQLCFGLLSALVRRPRLEAVIFFVNVTKLSLCVASVQEWVVREFSFCKDPLRVELLADLRAGDNALLDSLKLPTQRCKPASTTSLLQTHGSASSAVVGDACGKLTSTSARPVNPADALRRTPSRRHGVPVQCAGSTHRLDSRSLQDLTRSRPAGSAHANSSKKQH